jgi:pimeloyl-ACP methyl ester carboxylesterase
MPHFSERGFACATFDLRGHGESEGRENLHEYRLADYVDDLGQVAGSFEKKPVVIAHSMGGLVAQKYAQDHEVAGLALLASVPISGVGYGYARAHPIPFLKFLFTRSGKAMINGEKLAKSLFFSPGIPVDQFSKFYSRLQDESPRALTELVSGIPWKPLKGGPPLMVAKAGRDCVIPGGRLSDTAKLYGVEAQQVDTLAHDVMLDVDWSKAVGLVDSWLSKSSF